MRLYILNNAVIYYKLKTSSLFCDFKFVWKRITISAISCRASISPSFTAHQASPLEASAYLQAFIFTTTTTSSPASAFHLAFTFRSFNSPLRLYLQQHPTKPSLLEASAPHQAFVFSSFRTSPRFQLQRWSWRDSLTHITRLCLRRTSSCHYRAWAISAPWSGYTLQFISLEWYYMHTNILRPEYGVVGLYLQNFHNN